MTVPSTTSRVSYSGNGVTQAFAVNFYFLENSHLEVILVVGGVETVQTLSVNYSVSGAGNPAGGTVTMVVPPPSGSTLFITRSVPATQETDYLANDPFPAETHERALDKLTMLVQQVKEDADRSLKIPLSSLATTNTQIQAPSANKLLAWSQTGTSIVNFDPANVVNVVGQQDSFADVFTGNGSQVNFTLTRTPGSIAALHVSVQGVMQTPNVDYTLSGTTLTFTTAPPAVNSIILARYNEIFAETSGDAANVRYVPAGSGAVTTNVQAKLRETVSVKDFGAVGDGVADDTAAIQAAVDTGKAVFFPIGNYRITSALNCTNRSGGGIRFIGEYWGLSGNGSVITMDTGGVGVDFTGSQFVSIENVVFISGTITPTTCGLLFARSTTSQFAQFCSLKNVLVDVPTLSSAYSGKGTVAVYNTSAELFAAENVYFLGDTAFAAVSANPYNIVSPYVTIDTAIVSASRVIVRGGNNTLTSKFVDGYCAYLTNITSVELDAYYSSLTLGAGTAFFLTGVTETKITGYIESLWRIAKLGNGCSKLVVDVSAPVNINAPFTPDTGFVGISFCDFIIRTTISGVTPDYFLDGAATNSIANCTFKTLGWSPAISATTVSAGNITNLTTDFNGNLKLASASVSFGNTSDPNPNSLDWYEEGTFTPSVIGSTTSGTGVYADQVGRFTKIGNIVYFTLAINLTSHTGTGNIQIDLTGLPVSLANSSIYGDYPVTVGFSNLLTLSANNILTASLAATTNKINLFQYPAGGGAYTAVPMDTSFIINLSGFYMA